MTAVSAAPARSLEQRMTALERANDIRVGRAKGKRALKAGELDPAPIIDSPGEEWRGCKVYDFLRALPAVGDYKAMEMMRKAEIGPSKRLGGLTRRQRYALYDQIVRRSRGRFS